MTANDDTAARAGGPIAGPPFEILSISKGGGYRYCRTKPPHPRRNAKGLYPLHRVLMENKFGRLLEPWEEVHHKDEVKTNDTIDNLELKSRSEHARHHHPAMPPVSCICPCGAVFHVPGSEHRMRLERSLCGRLYCSRACAVRLRKHLGCQKTIHRPFWS